MAATPPAAAPSASAAVGFVDVSTNPPDVTILKADGTFLGTSPTTLRLEAGEYDLVLRKEGYYDLETSIEVQAGDRVPFEIEMTEN